MNNSFRLKNNRFIQAYSLIIVITFLGCNSSSQNSDSTIAEHENEKSNLVSNEITVIINGHSKNYSLNDLKKFRETKIKNYEAIGGMKGPLGVNTWTGVSLIELLMDVDPSVNDQNNSDKQIVLTSIDDWFAVIKWPELFGEPRGGEVLYNIVGCNECHGINGEGTAPADHPPTPELINQNYDLKDVMEILRLGEESHANINPFTPDQLSESELQEILYWLNNPKAPVPENAFKVDPTKRKVILAYEMNGNKMTGADGLIQLIVEMDEFSSRYSHWVSRIEVK